MQPLWLAAQSVLSLATQSRIRIRVRVRVTQSRIRILMTDTSCSSLLTVMAYVSNYSDALLQRLLLQFPSRVRVRVRVRGYSSYELFHLASLCSKLYCIIGSQSCLCGQYCKHWSFIF